MYAKHIIPSQLPLREDFESWYKVIDFGLFDNQQYDYKIFAEALEKKGSLFSFVSSSDDAKKWLVPCYSYLKKCNNYIFLEKALLPNQRGIFCKAAALYTDDSLPCELKKIYDQLFASENIQIEDSLLDENFRDLHVVSSKYRLEDIAKLIDAELQQQYSNNSGNTASLMYLYNSLYSWISKSGIKSGLLSSYFRWYYPKRASIMVDMLSDSQREKTLIIAQSGKIDALAQLASSNLSDEDYSLLINNIDKIHLALGLLSDSVDDGEYADSNEGHFGETLVYNDLLQKYPHSQGYKVVWASKERNEPCFDFEIFKEGIPICYYDAKTTMRGTANSNSIPFFMRTSQWNFLSTLPENIPYFIARVFRGDNNAIKYLQISEKK